MPWGSRVGRTITPVGPEAPTYANLSLPHHLLRRIFTIYLRAIGVKLVFGFHFIVSRWENFEFLLRKQYVCTMPECAMCGLFIETVGFVSALAKGEVWSSLY